jgi:hypothetical protein
VNSEFRAKLEAKINANIEARKNELTRPLRRREYMGLIGAIQALRGVLELCEEVERELNP